MTHRMTIAGVTRDLPICKVTDDLYIGAFIMFGDAEITVACAKELLARAPKDYDYLLTAEAKSIPLIHEMGAPVRREDLLCRPQGSEGLSDRSALRRRQLHHHAA